MATPDSTTDSHRLFDRLGIFAAAACAVHCMAAPMILALAPLIGGIWTSPRTHWAFAAISIPAALTLLLRKMKGRSPRLRGSLILLASVGSSLILLGLAAPGAGWSEGLGINVACPDWFPGQAAEAAGTGCTDECCASVHGGGEEGRSLFIPIASLVTMTGGLLLVAAHLLVLRCSGCSSAQVEA